VREPQRIKRAGGFVGERGEGIALHVGERGTSGCVLAKSGSEVGGEDAGKTRV